MQSSGWRKHRGALLRAFGFITLTILVAFVPRAAKLARHRQLNGASCGKTTALKAGDKHMLDHETRS